MERLRKPKSARERPLNHRIFLKCTSGHMNMEAQPTGSTNEGGEKQASFEANAARAMEIQREIAEAAASGDFAKIAELSAEGQQLKSANENVVDADRQEATEMNAEMDAEKSRQEAEAAKAAALAAAEQARFAQEAAEKAAADQAAAEKLAEEIKSGVKAGETEDPSAQTEPSEAAGSVEASSLQQEGRVAETEEQKTAKKELVEKYPDIEVSTSENFPGAILVKGKDGKRVYSVREESGQLVGNVSGLMDDGSIGWTQRLGDDDIRTLEQNGIADILQRAGKIKPDSFEDLRAKQKERDLEQKNENELLQEINMFAREDQDGRDMLRDGLIKHVNEMSSDMQAKVAEKLFRDYEKDGIEKIVRTGYEVYKELKGTPFSVRFRELEDERLKSAGHGGFNL